MDATELEKTFQNITFSDSKESDIKRENANINGDTAMGIMLKYGSEAAKHFYLKHVIPRKFSRPHLNGDIHIHDLDFYALTTTCTQIDILKLFKDGFSTGHGHLREPNDIQSYAALACIAIQSNQNDQHGGQSIANFDYGLAHGVAKTFRRKYRENLVKALILRKVFKDVTCEEMDAKSLDVERNLAERGLVVRFQEESKTDQVVNNINGDYFDEEQKLYNVHNTWKHYNEAGRWDNQEECQRLEDFYVSQRWAFGEAVAETVRATYQAMEGLVHNLNTMHSRAGAQVPFSSINYGMDTSPEGRLVTRSVLQAHNKGLGHGETPIFPIHVFRVKKGVSALPDDPNYDLFQLACQVSAKRMFPNFVFLDAPFNAKFYDGTPETEMASMGCRTRVAANVHDPSKATAHSRGNLSFTTINLPRLAIDCIMNTPGKSLEDKRKTFEIDLQYSVLFFQKLEEMLQLCVEQLLHRFMLQSKRKVKNYPFLMGQGVWLDSEKLGPEDEVGEVLKHGTLSVGFIGLAETLTMLLGQHHGQSQRAREYGRFIVSAMRGYLDRMSRDYKLNFTLLATPAESLSGRFLQMDREKYGEIAGVTDREYYTNSFHVPVYFPIGIKQKIEIEAPYHELCNAGAITYVELNGDMTKNPQAFERVVRLMADSGIGYGAINHPIDYDPVCGYNGIINEECPLCGRKETRDKPFERIRRITGYLVGTLDRFNNAKRHEEQERVSHGF